MTLRMPQGPQGGSQPQTGLGALQVEIAQQRAETLGRLGTQLETALARLKAFDPAAAGPEADARRVALLDEAADKAWTLMVQRELCGLRHWNATVQAYGIPREVLNRMGRVSR